MSIIIFIVIRITDRMGPLLILFIIHTITIDAMPNFNGRGNGLETLRVNRP